MRNLNQYSFSIYQDNLQYLCNLSILGPVWLTKSAYKVSAGSSLLRCPKTVESQWYLVVALLTLYGDVHSINPQLNFEIKEADGRTIPHVKNAVVGRIIKIVNRSND